MKLTRARLLKFFLAVGILALILFVAYEDSDGTTFHDFFDFSTLHHEHIEIMLATLDGYVILYPTIRIEHWSIHASLIALLVGGLLISAGLLNLPDNLRYLGGSGISGTQAILAGTVYNYSKSTQPIVGATANISQGNLSLAVTTDTHGDFAVLVRVNTYTVRLNATGFQTETLTGVRVGVSRGAHYLFFMVPLVNRNIPPPPPPPAVNNTNATNVPPPPIPPPPIPVLFYPSWCPAYATFVAANGTRIVACVVAIRPFSQLALFSGIILSFFGVAGMAYGFRRYGA